MSQAKACALGKLRLCSLSLGASPFDGWIIGNAVEVRETLAATPLDKLMLETDCPFLAPVPYRGKRCEPAYVKEIAEAVAEAKGCSLDELSRATCATARGFFRGLE